MGYEGEIVLNYKLTKKLGEGGFGAVYLAEHVDLGRHAACKVLHPQYAREPSVVERFFREARAVCAIGHRAIVQIENFGALPAGEPFYLMEYFPGRSLQDECKRRSLGTEQLVAIFDPVADALAAAHGRGIIHRDLKPDNIMVRFEGERVADVRLLDFGIAKLMDVESGASVTGSTMGTPNFMAPEQAIDAKNVDVRADVYAFAATVFAAIAGRPPFVGASIAAIMVMVQMDAPPPLRTLVPEAPEAVEALIARCLAKSRDYRPATVAACWAEMRAALLAHPMARAPRPAETSGVAPTEAPDPGVATPDERPRGTSTPATRAGHGNAVDRSAPTSAPLAGDRNAPTSAPHAGDRSAPTSALVDRSAPTSAPYATPPPRAVAPLPASHSAPRRSKLPLIVGVGAALAIGGIVAVVLAMRNGGTQEATREPPRDGSPQIDAAAVGDVPSTLTREQLDEGQQKVLAALAPCDRGALEGTWPVRLQIGPDGRATYIGELNQRSVGSDAKYIDIKSLLECVNTAIATYRWPKSSAGAEVRLELPLHKTSEPPSLAELTAAQIEPTLAEIRQRVLGTCDGSAVNGPVVIKVAIDARGRATPRDIKFMPAIPAVATATAFSDCIEGVLARTPFPASKSGGKAETRVVYPEKSKQASPPDAGVPPVDAPARPGGCSEAAFMAIANEAVADKLRAALSRLPGCKLDQATAARIQQALVAACIRISADC
jgi:serine/threonine-protein kinase